MFGLCTRTKSRASHALEPTENGGADGIRSSQPGLGSGSTKAWRTRWERAEASQRQQVLHQGVDLLFAQVSGLAVLIVGIHGGQDLTKGDGAAVVQVGPRAPQLDAGRRIEAPGAVQLVPRATSPG